MSTFVSYFQYFKFDIFIIIHSQIQLKGQMRILKKTAFNIIRLQTINKSRLEQFNRLKNKSLNIRTSQGFSTLESSNQNPANFLSFQGDLQIRNSQTLQLKLTSNVQQIQILLKRGSTVKDLINSFNQKLMTQNCKVVCHQGLQISQLTSVQALLNRMFFIISQNSNSVKVQGQFLHSLKDKDQSIQLLKNIELPLITRRQIEQYFKRVDTFLQSKYGQGLQGNKINISAKQVKGIVIQALRDRRESVSYISSVQDQYQKLYWQILDLKDKKQKALSLCCKIVRNRLLGGLALIAANTGFIWSGTYLFFSWDIIEPLAYFVSSFSGIILTAQFFKLKKPFTNLNYRQYLINKYSQRAYTKMNLDINQLISKEQRLQQLESIIKDYYLSKL